jgi:hypothetical protein
MLLSVLVLGFAARSVGDDHRRPSTAPTLEIMSLNERELALSISWPWGTMAANHVMFNDHHGPFKAIVESTGTGVRVTFDGWRKQALVSTADKLQIIYSNAGRKEIDLVAEATSGNAVRIRPVDQLASQGKRTVIWFGEGSAKAAAKVSVEARNE